MASQENLLWSVSVRLILMIEGGNNGLSLAQWPWTSH